MDRRTRLIVIATSAAALMIGFDFTGAAAVVTQIEADFSSDLTTTQWILTIYALTFGMGVVAGGKLGDTFGHRTVLLAGLALFGVASLAVPLAPEISIAIGTALFTGAAGTAALDDEFAAGMHAVFTFTAVAAALGLLNSFLVRTRDVRAARTAGEG